MDIVNKLLKEKPGRRLDRLSSMAWLTSISHFAIMWIAFIVSRGKAIENIYPVPMALILLYFGTLLVYVPVKETLRWKQSKQRYVGKRLGENFILLWVISLLAMGVMQFFTEGYFRIPEGMWETAVGALAIGGLSSISKGLHDCKNDVCDKSDFEDREESKTPSVESVELKEDD